MLATALAVTGMFAAPGIAADEKADAKKAEQKAKKEAAALKKYDKNANGKLDPDEEALMKEDQAKAKAEKAEKKKKKDQEKAQP